MRPVSKAHSRCNRVFLTSGCLTWREPGSSSSSAAPAEEVKLCGAREWRGIPISLNDLFECLSTASEGIRESYATLSDIDDENRLDRALDLTQEAVCMQDWLKPQWKVTAPTQPLELFISESLVGIASGSVYWQQPVSGTKYIKKTTMQIASHLIHLGKTDPTPNNKCFNYLMRVATTAIAWRPMCYSLHDTLRLELPAFKDVYEESWDPE
jgi:hypothetical protein